MTKKMFVIAISCLVAASVNAQSADQVSTAASVYSDKGCLDIFQRPDKTWEVSNCAGFYISASAGATQLNWENNQNQDGNQLAVEYKASVGYRFMEKNWPCAIRLQADFYMNGPTSVEGLRQGFTPGYGLSPMLEFNPHGAIRLGIGGEVKTRNLTSLARRQYEFEGGSVLDTDRYGGNVVLYGPAINVNIPLFKVFKFKTMRVGKHNIPVHYGTQVSLDIHGSYMMGNIQKKWEDTSHKVDFKEAGVTAGITVKF